MKKLALALLLSSLLTSCTQIKKEYFISKTETSLILTKSDQTVLNYNFGKVCPHDSLSDYYCRSGFIHPLYSPSGAIISDDFPIGHTHQHAVFSAWTKTYFKEDTIDFWNQHKEQGTVNFKNIDSIYHDNDKCGFISKHEHYSFAHGAILDETWEVSLRAIENYNIIDFSIEQKNITSDTLFIPNYHYGGMGFRGSKNWNASDKINYIDKHKVITGEGKKNFAANHSRPGWLAMYGKTKEGVAGMAVFCHKDNFMHPQPVRVHPTMPYFSLTPVVDTSFYIAPQAVYKMQYRVLTFDNEPDAEKLDSMFRAYAQ